MRKDKSKQKAKIDLFVVFLFSCVPMIVYLVFEQSWRSLNQNSTISFLYKFSVQSLLAYSLAGLGFTIVMLWRKEKLSSYGLVKKNAIVSVLLSVLVFVPHLIFLIATKGYHGYVPMSGAIIYDSIVQRSFLQQILCMIIVFAIWGFCEGFTYVYVGQKINTLFPIKSKYINWGAVLGGILMIKDINKNAWGCIVSFLFLWNAFP